MLVLPLESHQRENNFVRELSKFNPVLKRSKSELFQPLRHLTLEGEFAVKITGPTFAPKLTSTAPSRGG
jgi:hypothetical protein